MRAKDHNGISVWLEVDGEKLDENSVERIQGSKKKAARMECYIQAEPHQQYTICAQLGRQEPWTQDFIAEPYIDGVDIHSLHIKKRWHVTHRMETFFRNSDEGKEECTLAFGSAEEIEMRCDEDDDDDDNNIRTSGTIVVGISRGEIDRIKPVKKKIKISTRATTRMATRSNPSGMSVTCDDTTAFAEEFTYSAEDRAKPWVEFVFKIRTNDNLVRNGLIDRKPAQQHPCQVSNTNKIKAEPKYDVDDELAPSSAPMRSVTPLKREASAGDDMDDKASMLGRLKALDEANRRLQRQVEMLLAREKIIEVD